MTKYNLQLAYIIQRYRFRKGYSIEELASKISVELIYIQSIELGTYNKVIPKSEIKIVLKKISYALNLKYYKVLSLYEKEKFNNINLYHKPNYIKNTINNVSINNTTIKRTGLFLSAILIMFYIGYQIYFFIQIPQVVLANPNEIEYVYNPEYSLKGSTDPNSQLTLNGQRVKINTDGEFEFNLNLNKGTNIMEFVIEKNNKSKLTILKKVYLK